MKELLLILSFALSCLFSDKGTVCSESWNHDTVVECSESDAAEESLDFNDLAILPVRTATYSVNGNGLSSSVRSSNAGRRVQSSTKSAYRVVKTGKVSDRTILYSFRAAILQFPSGIHSNSRYIHSICHLLI